MCSLAISQCIFALLVLCTQESLRSAVCSVFFPTQQFDAALSGITFATPICTPSVTLLLPNLLPSSLLPPAGSGRKYIQRHIKFEPQPLPPRKKVYEYQPAPGFTSFWIIPPEPPLYWFLFHFLPAGESVGVSAPFFFVVVPLLWRYPELQRQRCDWLLGRFTHRSHHAPPLLPWGNTWAEPAAALERHERAAASPLWLRGHAVNTPLIIITGGGGEKKEWPQRKRQMGDVQERQSRHFWEEKRRKKIISFLLSPFFFLASLVSTKLWL